MKMDIRLVALILIQSSLQLATAEDKHPNVSIKWHEATDLLADIPDYSNKDYMFVRCKLPENVPCAPSSEFALFLDDVPLGVEECKYSGDDGFFYVQINDSRILNKLRCEYREESIVYESLESPIYPFVHCPTNSEHCIEQNCPSKEDNKDKYCLWTLDGPQPCRTSFDAAWCETEMMKNEYYDLVRYCPVDKVGFCAAMVEDPAALWYSTKPYEKCLPRTAESPVSYKGKPLTMGQFVVIEAGDVGMLRFECPIDSPFYESEVTTYDFEEVLCKGHVNMPFKDYPAPTLATWYFWTRVHGNDSNLIQFSYRAIYFGTVSVAIEKRTNTSPLRCRMQNGPKDWNPNFRVVQWWTRTSTENSKIPSTSNSVDTPYSREKIWHLNVTEKDNYQCHINITFQSCSPHFTASYPISSQVLLNIRGPGTSAAYSPDVSELVWKFIVAIASWNFVIHS